MGLSVIGAGFGRTGTESMKRALEVLGLGRCHHMYEVLPDPRQYSLWSNVAAGAPPDWDEIYRGFGAAVDWPTCAYWRELAQHWPEAKIILTIRDAESWHASMEKTILTTLRDLRAKGEQDKMGYRLVAQQEFGGLIDDPAHVKAVYDAHNQAVIDEIPEERLLVYHLGSGWDPICQFLDLPVPETPFPRGNAPADFHARAEENTRLREEAEGHPTQNG